VFQKKRLPFAGLDAKKNRNNLFLHFLFFFVPQKEKNVSSKKTKQKTLWGPYNTGKNFIVSQPIKKWSVFVFGRSFWATLHVTGPANRQPYCSTMLLFVHRFRVNPRLYQLQHVEAIKKIYRLVEQEEAKIHIHLHHLTGSLLFHINLEQKMFVYCMMALISFVGLL
jgi:hypothetical protein